MSFYNATEQNSAISYLPSDRSVIEVCNVGSRVIKAGTAAAVESIVSAAAAGEFNGTLTVRALPAESGEKFWGIAVSDIAPGGSGNMIVSGVANAVIASGTGAYAQPGKDGKLIAVNSGNVRILFVGDEFNTGVVLLGGGGNFSNIYYGDLAVRHIEGLTFEVYDGSYPETDPDKPWTNVAGHTDLPGAESVPRQTITMNGFGGAIYLVACFNDGVYSTLISDKTEPFGSGAFACMLLASVDSSGSVSQHFWGGTAYFGREWFL